MICRSARPFKLCVRGIIIFGVAIGPPSIMISPPQAPPEKKTWFDDAATAGETTKKSLARHRIILFGHCTAVADTSATVGVNGTAAQNALRTLFKTFDRSPGNSFFTRRSLANDRRRPRRLPWRSQSTTHARSAAVARHCPLARPSSPNRFAVAGARRSGDNEPDQADPAPTQTLHSRPCAIVPATSHLAPRWRRAGDGGDHGRGLQRPNSIP
jgi:hypothetical protein